MGALHDGLLQVEDLSRIGILACDDLHLALRAGEDLLQLLGERHPLLEEGDGLLKRREG